MIDSSSAHLPILQVVVPLHADRGLDQGHLGRGLALARQDDAVPALALHVEHPVEGGRVGRGLVDSWS